MIGVVPRGGESPVADLVTLVVWCVLALAWSCLLLRRPQARRGAWLVVTGFCVVVALDKAFDLQTIGHHVLQQVARIGETLFGAPAYDRRIKAAILLAGTLLAVAGIGWLVHGDRPLDGGRLSALSGIVLVVSWVGTRFVPGLSWLADERIGWTVEAIAVVCLCLGLRRALGGAGVGPSQPAPSVR